jgi:hypothetical protein
VIAITCAGSADALTAALAIVAAALAAFFATNTGVATACVDAGSYGDERRFPLRAPFALLLGPAPLAALLASAGFVVPLLVLAAGNLWGLAVLAVGVPIALLAGRSLHTLANRMVVLVPAGLVVVDPLTLSDPALIVRERVARIVRTKVLAAPPGVIDLRLGTSAGSVGIDLEPTMAFARRRGRRDAEVVEADGALIALLRPDDLVTAAQRHLQLRS